MRIVKHHKECVELLTISAFKKLLAKSFGISTNDISFDEDNKGVIITKKFWSWNNISAELGWFDEAEIVTDKNEIEKVMIWLNVD